MLVKAQKNREENITTAENWEEFMKAINERKQTMSPWCNVQQCEIDVKERDRKSVV